MRRQKTDGPAIAAQVIHLEHIGVDEAGRGCLAGPVAAAAVLAPANYPWVTSFPGLSDSKTLPEGKREALAELIRRSGLAWSLGLAWPMEIDQTNILRATFRAMSRAVINLRLPAHLWPRLYLDGPFVIPPEEWRAGARNMPACPEQSALVRGDALLPSISAASILAKTARDKIMRALARRYPGYGLERHKGYGTKEHLEVLASLGASPLHRRTFRGVCS